MSQPLKIAFLFPGQGSQYAGMGREMAATYPSARAVFDEADDALGFSLSKLCFEGPAADLALTANTQPAILAVSAAVAAVMEEHGIQASFVAGHSLGEYSACVCAGALGLRDALILVRRRGEYMQQAVPAGEGAMAALLGGPPGSAEAICREAAGNDVCVPANLNSPGQVVIAGSAASVARAAELAKNHGVRRAVMLNVSAPFHSPLMQPAAERLAKDLDEAEIQDAKFPVVANACADFVLEAAQIRDALKRQVVSPVRWEESIRKLLASGANHMIEAGPGKVLSGLMRQIDPAAGCAHIEDVRSLAETLEKVRALGR
ncbi:MAG: ACP S-malonyltransferase [Acidobacteriota bacterium]|nr:ACP S-malonyltransferase [Acidobacteriota bacterium]